MANSSRKTAHRKQARLAEKWAVEMAQIDSLRQQGQLHLAAPLLQTILNQNSNYAEANQLMGIILYQQQDFDGAIRHLDRYLKVFPDNADAWFQFAVVHDVAEQLPEAIHHYRRSLVLNSKLTYAHFNLGYCYSRCGQLQNALASYRHALSLADHHQLPLSNFAHALFDAGRIEEAKKWFEAAINQDPDNLSLRSTLLNCLNYSSEWSREEVFNLHLQHGSRFEPSVIPAPHIRSRDKIRIAYLSPDFCFHAVANFIRPVLTNYNSEEFEVTCLHNNHHSDDITDLIASTVDGFHNISELSDTQLVETIRSLNIDILVDLAGHTANSRLRIFGQRAAPIQATWLGYPNSTGLQNIDYRIVDQITDPQEEAQQFATETLCYMPESFICFDGDASISSSRPQHHGEPPANIVFGSFNNIKKITPNVISCWSEILRQVPQATLLIKAKPFTEKAFCKAFLDQFASNGIGPERIVLKAHTSSYTEHLKLYEEVDIALDTFPYNGTTTTCEALWMNVPVITYKGTSHASRVGASILSTVGLHQMVAEDIRGYTSLAVDTAKHWLAASLQARPNTRAMMLDSPLCDGVRFTRNLENQFRSWTQSAMSA